MQQQKEEGNPKTIKDWLEMRRNKKTKALTRAVE